MVPISLIDTPWIPVRRQGGTQDWISPLQIGDPDILALDARRADFNGALAQFLIGLLQTSTPMDSQEEWEAWLDAPPGTEALTAWFEPVREAFNLDGEGARFMQDLTLKPEEAETKSVAALLLESPGEKALRDNADHFVKRGTVGKVCPPCVAQALLTLQVNAPSGGAGHRTSLRGGGPLTTLVISAQEAERSLWRDLWLNVRERSSFLSQGGDPEKSAPMFSFPWMTEIISLQAAKGEFSPLQGHPAHVFWAMPRRIRLDFDGCGEGTCDLCGKPSDRLVSRYVTKNYGLNYKGPWNHPLSPYYENKPGEWLPFHPQPGGYGYKHWLPWVMGAFRQGKRQRPATVVSNFLTHKHRSGQFRLWAFGYDMDNMKARCWYEATLPLYGLASHDRRGQSLVQAVVGQWVEAASLAALYLRDAVRQAWFGSGGEVRGDLSSIDAAFQAATEAPFYSLLRRLVGIIREMEDDEFEGVALHEEWHACLMRTAKRLFDDGLVGPSFSEIQNPRRVIEAYRELDRKLRGVKLRQAVGLSPQGNKSTDKATEKVKEA